MITQKVKVYTVAKGELPPTDRFVLCWSDRDIERAKTKPSFNSSLSGPQVLLFKHGSKTFWWRSMLQKPDYWCFLEDLYG